MPKIQFGIIILKVRKKERIADDTIAKNGIKAERAVSNTAFLVA